MDDKLTTFDEFKKLKARRRTDDGAGGATAPGETGARAAHGELLALLDDTARLVQRLADGAERDLARAIARRGVAGRDEMRGLARRYERLSWRLCGQLRYILDSSRKW